MATLKVTRLKKILGFAIGVTLFVDGEEVGKLTPGTTLTKELAPGVHNVRLLTIEKGVDQEVTITDTTNTVEITFKLRLGFLTGVAKIVDIKYN